VYSYPVENPKQYYWNFALAKIFEATEDCLEKSIEDLLAEFSATLAVKWAAALSFNTGMDLIAIAMVLMVLHKITEFFCGGTKFIIEIHKCMRCVAPVRGISCLLDQ
jgi:hypothetical protein